MPIQEFHLNKILEELGLSQDEVSLTPQDFICKIKVSQLYIVLTEL